MAFMAYGGGLVSGLCGGLVNLGSPAGDWTGRLFSVGLLKDNFSSLASLSHQCHVTEADSQSSMIGYEHGNSVSTQGL